MLYVSSILRHSAVHWYCGLEPDFHDENAFKMHLWTKSSMQLYHSLGRSGNLILNIDATGGLLNFPTIEPLKDKLLHTKLTLSGKYVLVDEDVMQETNVNRLLSPVMVAEMVSNKNTAADYVDFYRKVLESEALLFPNEQAVTPLMCMTDCSAQLESAALAVFSTGVAEDVTVTRIVYGNTVMLYLLCYDGMICEIDLSIPGGNTIRKQVACEVFKALKKHTGIFLKECKSHVYRAPQNWAHNSKKLPASQK